MTIYQTWYWPSRVQFGSQHGMCWSFIRTSVTCNSVMISLWWRHNGRDGLSNHQPRDCLLNRLFGRRSKKTSKLRFTGLCAGNSAGTGEFPAQRASNAENVSIWWRHHDISMYHFSCMIFVYASSQWETALECNAISHWLGGYTEWFLISTIYIFNTCLWLIQFYSRQRDTSQCYETFITVRHSVEVWVLTCIQLFYSHVIAFCRAQTTISIPCLHFRFWIFVKMCVCLALCAVSGSTFGRDWIWIICQLEISQQISAKFKSKFKHCQCWKCIEKYHLQSIDPFVQGWFCEINSLRPNGAHGKIDHHWFR